MGIFISVEGIDGCGKTGIVEYVLGALSASGYEAVGTREPGGTSQGERLRALLLSGSDDAWDPHSELLLMTAARIEHARRVIEPALRAGKIVVSDRFVGSTIAYQGAGRGLSSDFIRSLHVESVGNVWPNLTIVLDLAVEIGLDRSRKRLQASNLDEGRFEALDLAFHQRIRQSYLDQAARSPEDHVVIDAAGTPDQTNEAVLKAIGERFRLEPWPT